MNDEQSRDLEVFAGAVKLPAEEQAAYLAQECGDDHSLRARVEALLRADSEAGNFMEQPPGDLPAANSNVIGDKTGDHIGRYKLLQQIGEGGCGVVFMAEQEEPVHRRVALKIIKPGMDTKSVIARFEAERQALALMDHPSIAKVFDAGATESGRPYFVMELVRGVKITQYCDENSLTTGDRLKLFVQVCQAVQHAHQRGIIHRDIKPSNILVTTTEQGTALPVVIDFGVAKATGNQRLTDKTVFTAFEMLVGTPAYMSPEQAAFSSVDVDTRTDIYSLGVLLYELLTSSTPFETGELLKAGLDEILRVIREEEPLRPSTRLSKMPGSDLTTVAERRQSQPPRLIHIVCGDLDWIAMKALEKDRTRRYETANGLALDIQRFLKNEPVSARPPSKFYRFQKAVQRNKLLFGGVVIIALLLIVSLIVVSTSLAEERRSRRDAEAASVKSQQVTKFLETLLQGVAPAVARGQDTKMLRGILDQTSENIGKEMTNQPAVEAELRNLIGTLYRRIGNYGRAEEMHSAALAIRRKVFGSNNPKVAESLNELGLDLQAQNKPFEAEKATEEALVIRRGLFGAENRDTATSLNDLGAVYRDEKRLSEAEALAREALEIRQRLFGEENLDVADSLRNLSITLDEESKWVEGEATARKVLVIRRKLIGPDHPWIASAIADIAWAASNQGKLGEAEALQREALAMRRKLLPEEHPDVVYAMRSLGGILEGEFKWSEAGTVFREALVLSRRRVGNHDPQALADLENLVRVLMHENKISEAQQMFDEVLSPSLVKDRASTRLLVQRVQVLARQKRWPEATADAVRVLERDPAAHPPYHELAGLLAITRDQRAYEQLCQKMLALFADAADPYIVERVAADCLLLPNSGTDLQLVDKLATKAVESGSNQWGMPFFRCAKASSAYRMGHFREAIEWLDRSLQVLKSPDQMARARAAGIRAMALWRLGESDAARASLAEGERFIQEFKGNDLGELWRAWAVARITLDEATELITPP
jgi:eukaryotic-like serine/threonine-protein kinase